MFSLKIKVFSIILLSVIFTGEEIAKDSTPHIMFERYAKVYYNFPYHTYFLFPRRGQDHFFERRVSNFDFFLNLNKQTAILGHSLDLLFVYFYLFSTLIYRSFERGNKGRGFFFLITSVFNILSLVFIPQYVFLIGKYSSYKGLLRLNLETGFYLSNNEKGKKLITLAEQKGIAMPLKEEQCSICLSGLWDDDNGKQMKEDEIKQTVTALPCNGIRGKSHYYHTTCLGVWASKESCPICKREFHISDYLSKDQQDYMLGNGDLTQEFFAKRNYFSTMMYADVTLCIDNFDIVVSNPYETYWFAEIILLRLGAQILSPAFTYTFNPFIGFCGVSIRFYNFILSLVPTYMIKDSLSIYPGKILLDIQLSFNFGDITLYV